MRNFRAWPLDGSGWQITRQDWNPSHRPDQTDPLPTSSRRTRNPQRTMAARKQRLCAYRATPRTNFNVDAAAGLTDSSQRSNMLGPCDTASRKALMTYLQTLAGGPENFRRVFFGSDDADRTQFLGPGRREAARWPTVIIPAWRPA